MSGGPSSFSALRWVVVALSAASMYVFWPLWPALVFARLGSLKMPTFLLFVSLFGGIAAFGAWGAALGPLIVRLWLQALALQGEADRTASEQS